MTPREQPARLIYSTTTAAATRCAEPGCGYLAYADHCPHHNQEQDHTP